MFLLRIYNVLDLFESALDNCWIQMDLVIGMLPEEPIRCYIMLSKVAKTGRQIQTILIIVLASEIVNS